MNLLSDDGRLDAEKIKACPSPCWILTSETESNVLSGDTKLPRLFEQLPQIKHFQLTIIPFQKISEPSPVCIEEKRLSLDCLIQLSLFEVRKKIKDPALKYFFMRKYADQDYFLFTQTR